MNRRHQRQMQLIDCQQHGAESELFIVEGESAASSVSALCNAEFQAVLPLQGKPLNAFKASEDKVLSCPLYHQFAEALGLSKATAATPNELANLRFGKVFLLFDPDADGIHIGALFLLYLKRWLPELLDSGKVFMLRTPMFGLEIANVSGNTRTEYAFLPQQLTAMKADIAKQGDTLKRTDYFQSLGSVPPEVLSEFCIYPDTRQANVISEAHMDAVVATFG